ncbi:MAG TPA: hypothetical protein VK669_01175 [Candidatus Limnocylindrales bacterium]|nr:hypothetical protein [Candidatus Limnocylindrales bacterium]
MSWILGGEQNFLPYRHKIVYTSAANGIGPGRRTLIPAFCSLEGLPTANSDAYSCAINRHKFHCAMLLKELGFRVPRTWWYDAEEGWFQDDRPTIGDRVIAKSTFEGASLGVSAATVGEFGAHMEREIANASRDLRQPMTVQEFIRGNELEVPVLRLPDRYIAPSPVAIARRGGGRSPDDVLLYEDVYDDYYEFSSPGYSNEESRRISEIAERVAAALGFRGFSRVDFRIDEFGNPFVIDVSTTPHLTRTSSFNFIFDQMGFTYSDMLEAMIAVGAKQNDMI